MENNKKKLLVPKLSLWVRVVVGAYLLYTAYGLAGGLSNQSEKNLIIFGAFTIAFAVIGVFLVINGGIHLYKGEFVGGKADTEETETTVTEADLPGDEVTKDDDTKKDE